MKKVELFKLFGSIFVNNEEANQKIDETDNKAKNTGLTLGGMAKTAAKWGAGIVSAAGAGLFALAAKVSDSASEINDMSVRTGLSTDKLQEMKFASEQVGVNFESITGAVGRLTKTMGDAEKGTKTAVDAFDKLGVKTKDSSGNLRSMDDVFPEVIKKLADMTNETDRNALAMDVFGKGALELGPLLSEGGVGIDELSQKAHDLGLVLSEDAINSADTFGDTMDQIKSALGGVVAKIGVGLMPTFQLMMDWVIAHMPEIQEGISTAVNVAGDAITWLSDNVLPKIVVAFQWLGDNVIPIVVDAFQLLGDGVQFVMDNMEIFLPIIIGLTAAILAQAVIGTITNLMKAWSTATKSQTAFQWLLNAALNANPLGLVALAIGAVIAVGILLWKNWDTVKEKASQFWNYLKDVMRDPINFILGAINTVIGAYEKMINGLGTAINKIPSIKIPDWVPGFGGKEFGIPDIPTISLPRIPLLAEGADILEAGRVIVGDEGPEFLDVPKAARVTPLDHPSVNQPSVIHTTINVDGRKLAEANSRPSNDRVTSNKWGSGRVVPV